MPKEFTRFAALVKAISNHKTKECLHWPYGLDNDGYGKVWYEGKTVRAARLVFFLTNKRWPTPLIRHICDVRDCVHPKHIIEGTYADNVADCIKRGRFPDFRGERNACAKITDEIVRAIRRDYRRGDPNFSQEALGRRYGIKRRHVGHILSRERWKHI